MALSTNLLTTAADCDKLTKILEKEKDDLEFRKIQLTRQKKSYGENAVEITAELQAVTSEIASLDALIATLPDGDMKTKNTKQRKQADLRLFNLEERQDDYGAIALIEREVELVFSEAQLASVNTALGEVAARKAGL